jgi:hypothetical protein
VKKNLILVIVVLFGLVLALQYAQKNKRGAARADLPAVSDEGVALPADAGKAEMPEISADMTGSFRKGSSYGELPALIGPKTQPACEGGGLGDMLRAHGKLWGHAPKGTYDFDTEATNRLYTLLSDVIACEMVQGGRIDACASLPGAMEDARPPLPFDQSPSGKCLADASVGLFFAHMAGLSSNPTSCHMFMDSDRMKGTPVTAGEVCKAAEKGFDKVCETLAAARGGDIPMADCRDAFPRNAADCSTKDCKETFQLYDAMRAKSVARCPERLKTVCAAAITGDRGVCVAAEKRLSKAYCDFLSERKKFKGKYAGMTLAEERAARAEDAKMEAQRRKEEEELNRMLREQSK